MNPKQSSNASTLERALKALEKMEAKLASIERAKSEPIAIVGMACRFPGTANSPTALWERVASHQDLIAPMPTDRYRDSPVDLESSARRAGWLHDIDQFDAAFFGISRNEAVDMDPQQRLLLEVAWEAIEDAALAPDRLQSSKTGVFIGNSGREYLDVMAAGQAERPYVLVGNAVSMAAGRLAHLFGLHGPAMVVDSACASSLVALHLACRSLRSRECDMAVVGGSNLLLSSRTWEQLEALRVLSNQGQCRTFDARADGYARAEGIGVVIVERLSDAQNRRDPIWALLRGSAVNHTGLSASVTAPNVQAQAAVIRAALDDAKIGAERVGYVEVHSNGSPLGDAIELEALKSTLGKPRANGSKCILGSIKTLFGHAEAASGMASLMKAVSVLQHGMVPPNLHFQALTPYATIDDSSLVIATSTINWERGDQPRIAGVSGTGISGTNAHVVLEEPPPIPQDQTLPPRAVHALILSAKSHEALIDRAKQMVGLLARQQAHDLGSICHTLAVGRHHFEDRFGVVVHSREHACSILEEYIRGESARCFSGRLPHGGTRKRLGLFLPSSARMDSIQGLKDVQSAAFHEALRRVDEVAAGLLGQSISADLDRMLGLNGSVEKEAAVLAIQVALLEMWRALGIDPLVITGQGTGECVALWAAGVLALPDVFALAMARARAVESKSRDVRGILQVLGKAEHASPRRTLIPGTSGQFSSNAWTTAEYWLHSIQSSGNTRHASMDVLMSHDLGAILSCGISDGSVEDDKFIPLLRSDRSPTSTMLEAAVRLFVLGYEPNWSALDAPHGYQRVRLPTYPFQRQKYWFVNQEISGIERLRTKDHPLLGRLLETRADQPEARTWDECIDASTLARLGFEHFVEVQSISSGAVAAMAHAAAQEFLGDLPIEMKWTSSDVPTAVVDEPSTIQVIARPRAEQGVDVELYWRARTSGPWERIVQGNARVAALDAPRLEMREPGDEYIFPQYIWERRIADLGFSSNAVSIQQIRRSDAEVFLRGRIVSKCGPEVFLQLVVAVVSTTHPAAAGLPWTLAGIDGFTALRELPEGPVLVRLKWLSRDAFTARASAEIVGETGDLLVRVRQVEVRARDPIALRSVAWKDPLGHALTQFVWEQRAAQVPDKRSSHRWLVILNEGKLGSALARQLESKGDFVVTIPASVLENRMNDLSRILTENAPISGVVHCGLLDVPAAGDGTDPILEDIFLEWICVVHPMLECLLRCEFVPRLWIITRAAQAVENDTPVMAHAGVVGFGRMVSAEYPEAWGGVIDLGASATSSEIEMVADVLVDPNVGEITALRGSKRYVRRLQRIAGQTEEKLIIRPDRTYVISQGICTVGYEVARWLVARGAKSLLFVDDPAAIAAYAEDRKRLNALETGGVKVAVFAGDMADVDTLQGILYLAFDQITGVIHIDRERTDDRPSTTSRNALNDFIEQWRASCRVPWTLHGLTVDLGLDFFLLISSLRGALGWEGDGADPICADFHEAIVLQHRIRGGRALSLYTTAAFQHRPPQTEIDHALIAAGVRSISTELIMPAAERLLMQNDFNAIAGWIDWNDFAHGRDRATAKTLLHNVMTARLQGMRTTALREQVIAAESLQAQTMVEHLVRDEMARLLGSDCPPNGAAGTSPAALGADSIMMLQVLTIVGKLLGQTIPTKILLGDPTIVDLAQRIVETMRTTDSLTNVASGPSIRSHDHVVPMSSVDSGGRFFCVHPVTGSALVFQHLAHELTGAVRFYGFHAPGVESDATPCDSIIMLAHRYVEALHRVDSDGPYRLGGYSFGAPIAFEMARILQRAGKQIESCVLIDPMSPAGGDDASRLITMARLLRMRIDEDAFRGVRRNELIARMANAVGGVLKLPSDLAGSAKQLRVYRAHLHALLDYQPETYDGSVVLLRAEQTASLAAEHQLLARDKSFGWEKHCLRGIIVRDIPGDHFSLLTDPHVAQTAKILREALELPRSS